MVVAKKLNVLNFTGKIIAIAGTNGKGSTVIFLESILLAADLKTAAYISPHVLNYQERIRLQGKDVDEKTLCQAFALVEQARANVVLSYFEFSTLTALVIFKKQQPDVLLLEVGLGGRFDAVNILDSDIAVITTIAFDHTQILGNTREAIGAEKAGIMRPEKQVICGDNMPESIYAAAKKLSTKLYCLNENFFYAEKSKSWDWYSDDTKIENLPLPCLPIVSAALALMTVKLLSCEIDIPPLAIIAGVKKAFLSGRLQRIVFAGKEIIFDVAHNFEAMTWLAFNLAREKVSGRILAVVSMLKDKDIAASLTPLVKIVNCWYLGVLSGDRAASAVQLMQSLQNIGAVNIALFPTIEASLEQAIAECQENDRIVVFGSFYTVAKGLRICLKTLENK